MATKDSEELKANEQYPLGDYSFRIERTSVPGSTNDKIEAICTKGGKNARKSIQLPSSTQLDSYRVEVNETEATVYAVVTEYVADEWSGTIDPSTLENPNMALPVMFANNKTAWMDGYHGEITISSGYGAFYANGVNAVSDSPLTYTRKYRDNKGKEHTYSYTDNVPVPVGEISGVNVPIYTVAVGGSTIDPPYNDDSTWNNKILRDLARICYGDGTLTPTGDEKETKEILVGRFAIDLEDAGGVGPGSDWIDPGDYDPDWEPEDPTHTLYVEVTGALSGRHNDPIVDPSYSYIPADKDTVKDYGCGGDGGHGGGGGAGASTVVVQKFATNQANSKEVTALARRHGYGSGGGKGGKGGDGCILVYY